MRQAKAKLPCPTEHQEQVACACGCGLPVPIATRTDAGKGWVKGRPLRYRRFHRKAPRVRGRPDGYEYRIVPGHPRANAAGQVLEHVLIVERVLGHPLPPEAQVHHFNGMPSDNRHENLVACEDQAYHALLHLRQRALAACGNPSFRRCVRCKRYDAPGRLESHGKGCFVHLACRQAYKREWSQRQ